MTFEQWWQFAQTQTSDPLTDREKAIAAQAWHAAVESTKRTSS